MEQFTKEEQEQIRRENEKSDLRQFLKGCYSKIQDGLRKLDERSAERAVWELVQNARDLSEHAKIHIFLRNNSIEFEHYGLPFDFDSLSSLVKQVSSQDKEKGDKVGQYGTGFMTTHKFSKKVYIRGDYEVSVGDKTLYAELLDYRDEEHPVEFCLDRSGIDVDSFINEMFDEIESIKKLRFYANHDAPPIGKTSFRYELSEEKCAVYYPQIRQSLNLLPYVIAFNDRIDEIGYHDEFFREDVVYKRKDESSVAILDTTESEKIESVIEKDLNGKKTELRVHLLVNKDRSNRIVLPPLPIGYDDVSVIPSLFIFFPLLKTENWGVNFVYHSANLWPTEPRDCYQLPYNNEDVLVRAEHNAMVIKEMDDMLFNYYDRKVVEQQAISIDFAKVSFCTPNKADSSTVSYIEVLQKRWVNHITNWAVIPTKSGMRRISEPNVAVLSPELFSGLTDEQISQYLPVMATFAEKVKIIPNQNIQEWTNRICEWNRDEASYYVSISDICQSIKSKECELHTFLLLLNAIGKTEYMKEYALIPNREGILCKTGYLRSGQQITSELYSLAFPLLSTKLHVLVDPAYEDVYELSHYTRENLRDDMTSLISSLRSNLLGQNECLKSDSDAEERNNKLLLSLLNYCNAYRTQNPNSQRSSFMKLLFKLYGITFQQTFIPRVDGEDENLDLYNAAYMYLWEDTLLWLSKRDVKWLSVEANFVLLSNILDLLSQMGERFRTDMYAKYAIFPNRNRGMCLLSDLFTCDVEDETLFSLYTTVIGEDLNDHLVCSELEKWAEFKKKTIKSIGDDIDEKLQATDYKDKAVLTIIRHLDKNEWLDCFPNINLQKRELQYNQCDDSVRDSIYRLQMKDEDGSLLSRMANLVETENVKDILDFAEKQVEDLKEKKRQLEFKYAVGKAIEDALREKIGNDLEFKPEDVQNGQDMIIYKSGKPVYYIEVKSKWNFEQPAYISHNQVERAVIEKEHYALICVDCRKDDPMLEYGGGCGIAPNATYQEIFEKRSIMLAHTWVHTDIGRQLAPMMEGILEAKKGDEYSTIKVDGDFCGRIPLKVFINGITYDQFINDLIMNLR